MSVAGPLSAVLANVHHGIANDGEVSAVKGDVEGLAIVPEVVDGAAVFGGVEHYVILVAGMSAGGDGHRIIIRHGVAGFLVEVALARGGFPSTERPVAGWDIWWGFETRTLDGKGLVDAIRESSFRNDSSL